jgi:hypothetical protein
VTLVFFNFKPVKKSNLAQCGLILLLRLETDYIEVQDLTPETLLDIDGNNGLPSQNLLSKSCRIL